MSTAAERKFVNLRKRLDQLGYRQPLGVESLPLVEKLFSDLVHTTESLRNAKLSAGKLEKEYSNFDVVLEPYREENARLTRENNELHLEVLKLKEQLEQQVKGLKSTLRKVEHENADMKFLNNQYIHKIRSLEKETKAKTDKIQQLQEKNLQAVVQTPGGRKRNIPFRRQRMQIDQPVPPSGIGAYPIPQPDDPYIADLLQVAENRMHELQLEVSDLQEKLEIAERGAKNYSKQVELRDSEIERLAKALDGGRSHDVISLEAKSRSNEKIIAQLNLQVEFLQQTNKELEMRIQDVLDSKQNVTSEVVHLSNKNEELCQELSEIDHLAQQLERHKEIVVEAADKEIGKAKEEIKKKYSEIQDREEIIVRLKSELSSCRREKDKLTEELFGKTEEKQNLEVLLNQVQLENHRLGKKVENLEIIDRELVIELERMRLEGGIALGDKSPSRLDAFVKTIEEDRDYYKRELECLQKIVKRRSSPLRKSPEKNDDLRLVTRERDELQSMLDRFEKHMIEIQSNVKLLTAERDKLSILYEQSQDELTHLRRETKTRFLTQSHAEEERNIALSDFRRVVAEKEGLREKLKIHQEEKSKLEQEVADLENTVHRFETEQFDQITTISLLKDKIAGLEDELNVKSHQLFQSSEDTSQFKTELNSLQLLNEQLQKSLDEVQHRLAVKEDELHSAQEEILMLEEKIDKFNNKNSTQDETIIVLRSTINVLDKEKDSLQESIDEKTERIAYLDDNLANKEKTILHLRQTLTQLESSLNQLKDALSGKDRELASVRRQLDAAHSELGETGRVKEMALKENRRLQDDLATMARENQAISAELEGALHEREEMKIRVHNYITEVSRFESLMASKERENKELLEKFQMLHSQAESWEVKAHQAEGQSSSVRLELLSVDTERRHLRERVELLEKEIQEHIIAYQAYESQISSMAKNMARLEESLRREKEEKSSISVDVVSVRELCVKLESSKDHLSRQLTAKSLDFERVMSEFEDAKAEAELLKKQLSSERLTIQNLETLLATGRDKDFQNHLITHEKDSEIQLLKDKLTLSESKLTSLNREVSILRNKLAQLQADYDIVKRQLTTERFERERAIQEMRRHGLSTSSLRASSPLSSTLRSPSHSPERALTVTTERTDKKVGFED
ncbi:centrosomal protein of 135 kDa-like [Rhineura floridana]|uniref:centrosomal protein of 135 kDa-like n=1 Tax=Rhineura floridana TaxID=261503 RepID=UPI002AC800A7|nr:centrosomal protein of 135 kDa-like [Rhineura floridana]XP_061494240.1 centrosomal protein of 135 kDa-like [Rhineura floridana]XP_061494241.1 centrosomal protein of 135 kDa-like [Rhineura floridana]